MDGWMVRGSPSPIAKTLPVNKFLLRPFLLLSWHILSNIDRHFRGREGLAVGRPRSSWVQLQ